MSDTEDNRVAEVDAATFNATFNQPHITQPHITQQLPSQQLLTQPQYSF